MQQINNPNPHQSDPKQRMPASQAKQVVTRPQQSQGSTQPKLKHPLSFHREIKVSKGSIITYITFGCLFFAAVVFVYTVYTSLFSPFLQQGKQNQQNIALDSGLDEVVSYLSQRKDLTSTAPPARLNKDLNSTASAEVINGSGVPFAAKTFADKLIAQGIAVSKIDNSTEIAQNWTVGFKNSKLSYKDVIVSNIASKSADIKFETLDDTYPFDIRIVIGK